MKHLFLFFICLTCFTSVAQDDYKIITTDTLNSTYDILLKNELIMDNTMIQFIEVLEDSRCPKGVMCVRAGEAKVKVAVYENDVFIDYKTLIINAAGTVSPKDKFYHSKKTHFYGLDLKPYPTASPSSRYTEYTLVLLVKDVL